MAGQDKPWEKYGAPQGIQIRPASPRQPYEAPLAAADLESKRLENQKRAKDLAQEDSPIDPQTVTYYAQQVLAGAPMPSLGMGKQAAAARQAIMSEVARTAGARGLSGADLATQIAHYKAGSGQIANLEKQVGTVGVNEQTALANGQQYLDRSAELPGQTSIAPMNAVSNWIQRRFGGTTISAADAAYNTFTNEYAKVVAGSPNGAGTLSDSARHEAMSTISGSGSLAQKQAAFDQMKADMANRMIAMHGGINQAYKALTNQPGYQVPDSTQGLALSSASPDGNGGPFGGLGGGLGARPSGPSSGPGGGGANGYGAFNQQSGDRITVGGSEKAVDTPVTRAISGKLSGLLRSGAPDSEVLNYAASVPGLDIGTIQANLEARRKGWKGGYKFDFGNEPVTQQELSRNEFASSKPGAALLHGALAFGGLGNGVVRLGSTGLGLNDGKGYDLRDLFGNREINDAKIEGFRQMQPGASFVGDMAGSVMGAAGAEKLALKGLNSGLSRFAGNLSPEALAMASKVAGRAAPVVGDASFGALQGANAAPDGQAIRGAEVGGALGAGGGALGRYAIGPAIGRAVSPIANSAPIVGARNAVGGMFGRAPTIVPPNLSGPESQIFQTASKAGIPEIQAQLSEAQRLGVPMSLADTDPALTTLAGASIRRSPAARQIAESALLPRSRGQIDRFSNAVSRDLGPVANLPQTSADLSQQARTAAAPLYDKAYAAPGASSVDLSDLSQRPSMKAGLGRAYRIAQEEGRDPTSLGFDLTPQGEVTLTRAPSFQTLDYVKRGLDDTLEGHRDPMTGRLALNEDTRAINSTRASLLSRVDAVNPDYAAARKAFADPSASRDAMVRGTDAFSLTPDELAFQAGNQSPEHLAQMQLGFRSQMMSRANKARDASNPFESVLGSPAARGQVDALYPGNPGNQNLFQTRDLEGQLARSQNSILGNSMTAERSIADKTFNNPLTTIMMDVGLHATGQPPLATATLLGVRGGRHLMEKFGAGQSAAKAEAMAPTLFNTDPSAASASLSDLANTSQAYRDFMLAQRRKAGNIAGMFGASTGPLLLAGQ